MGRLLCAAPGLFLPVTVEAAKSRVLLDNSAISRHKAKFDLMIEQTKYGKLYGLDRKSTRLNSSHH